MGGRGARERNRKHLQFVQTATDTASHREREEGEAREELCEDRMKMERGRDVQAEETRRGRCGSKSGRGTRREEEAGG